MAGLTDEEGLDEQKKGPCVYQEQKCFDGEWSIINVYDNQETKRVTFEVYGCDTADIRRVQYNYVEFDAFFRFNAELMNPNRREGRYHWIAERLELKADGAGGRQLALASEPTPQIPEQPLYEKRKIPTGRMNYQERQRLRESMDQLDIKRNEAISKKRTEAKARFLVKFQEMKEEYVMRLQLRTDKIGKEREERWALKEEERRQELDAFMELEARNAVRHANVVTKVESSEERDAQEVKNILARYKEKEAIRQAEIKEARNERKTKRLEKSKEEKDTIKMMQDRAEHREEEFRQRELRVQKKRDQWLQDLLKEKETKQRHDGLKAEKKLEFIKDLHVERQKVFTEQNEKTRKRQKEIEDTKLVQQEGEAPAASSAEAEAPEQEETVATGKPKAKKKAAAKKKDKEKPKTKEKEADGAIIDGVEGRMRAEMQKQRELAALEKIRESKIFGKLKARIRKEADHAKVLRNQQRQREEKERAAKDQKAVIVKQSREEKEKELERKKNDLQRCEALRNENIQKKIMARLSTVDCGKALRAAEQQGQPIEMEQAQADDAAEPVATEAES
eukprot:gnl/MRDRNA2_/MRDRNA2_87649_c0_seq1.p1 gnl/MRDRNA2_/MRDRNA2_87649_c0~~gnl/MRDRNA2_/MRDRNA2_87649_c0_seq1.p1  ORF type:complete len:590 (-),score=204.62 gnl/MRDRNA2_/MRDRNA2_87649_c0_seq1:34-1725(-)